MDQVCAGAAADKRGAQWPFAAKIPRLQRALRVENIQKEPVEGSSITSAKVLAQVSSLIGVINVIYLESLHVEKSNLC